MQNGTAWQDYDLDTVTFVLVDNVSNGTLTLDSATGDFTYEPSTGFVGEDSFTYQLSDGTGTSTYTATVEIDVSNSIPEPNDDWAYTIHDQDATGGVAWNDGLMQDGSNWQDYEGDTVTFVLVDDVGNGTLTLDSATGDFTYEPDTGFVGSDTFTYQLSDGLGTSTYTATVEIDVSNSIPEPSDDWEYTLHDQEVTSNVAWNDGLTQNGSNWQDYEGDSVSFVLVDDVASGTLTLDSVTGDFTYEPDTGFVGDDSFTYELSDGLGTSTYIATVLIAVTNNVPEPSDDGPIIVQCRCDDPDEKTGNVAGNDGLTADGDNWKDYDGDSVTFVLVDNVTNGTLTFDTATGEFKYKQNEGYIGDDSFTYQITDGLGTSAQTATVEIDVVGMTADATGTEVTGTFTVEGNSTSSAAKGMFIPPGGVERETTDTELVYRKHYYMQYDGPTKFTVTYTVKLKPDGTFETTGSTVKMNTVYYTSQTTMTYRDSISAAQQAVEESKGHTVYKEGGKVFILKKVREQPSTFETTEIPITAATIVAGKLQSFKFEDAKWYGNPSHLHLITDKGIEGEIDLKKCEVTYKAKYQDKSDGVIGTFDVTGKIMSS